MKIDIDLLCNARPENVERLARALRIPLPVRPEGPALLRWRRHAAKAVARAIEAERAILPRAMAPW